MSGSSADSAVQVTVHSSVTTISSCETYDDEIRLAVYPLPYSPEEFAILADLWRSRWVVHRLSPLAFGASVAKLYFAEDWEAVTAENTEGGRDNESDARYFAAKLACMICEDDIFTNHERVHFNLPDQGYVKLSPLAAPNFLEDYRSAAVCKYGRQIRGNSAQMYVDYPRHLRTSATQSATP
jgi:hypothetical protein